jgi:5-oxoprolinase (ATP-hydrolysing) subunit A
MKDSNIMDINCDIGEGMSNDALIMPFITSANIACGYHAGDATIMRNTMALARKHNVNIGAHPSFKDKENFGRTEMHLSIKEIYDLIIVQLQFMQKMAEEMNVSLHHVKPHGALYNMSARNIDIAEAIAGAIHDFNNELILFGLSGSLSIEAAGKLGLKTMAEVFADRTYQDDGSLTSRKEANAMILTVDDCLSQVEEMVARKRVISVNGKPIPVVAETICIHGDGKNAIEFAEAISKKYH